MIISLFRNINLAVECFMEKMSKRLQWEIRLGTSTLHIQAKKLRNC